MNDTNNETPVSLTEAMNRAGVALTAAAANKVLHGARIIEKAWRPSSVEGRPPKNYWKATPTGEALGAINVPNDDQVHGGDPSSVRYDPTKFATLWASEDVQATFRMMLAEREIKLRDGAASGASQVF
jgi:hypothetical protein